MEKIDINKLGVIEEVKGSNGMTIGYDNHDARIIAEKVNEIVEWINSKKDQLL